MDLIRILYRFVGRSPVGVWAPETAHPGPAHWPRVSPSLLHPDNPSATASDGAEVPWTSAPAHHVPYGTLLIDPDMPYGTLRYLTYNIYI